MQGKRAVDFEVIVEADCLTLGTEKNDFEMRVADVMQKLNGPGSCRELLFGCGLIKIE